MATPEAFFQRCRDLRSAFFAEIFRQFTARLVVAVPPRYAAGVAPVHARFTDILLLDGSRLAAIAHRLKLLWRERRWCCPAACWASTTWAGGCAGLHFSADAAASEMTRAKAILGTMARDTLLLGDRLYCTADFFEGLHTQLPGAVSAQPALESAEPQRLSKRRHAAVSGRLARPACTGASAPPQLVRYIRWRHGGTRYELLTNVLAPARLRPPRPWP